jgi:hypothetical protein
LRLVSLFPFLFGVLKMGMFKKAVRHQLKGRIAIDGPGGAGKTFTALRLATPLVKDGRIAVINTESGAIQKYIGLAPDGVPWEFDICELSSFSPTAYTEAINEAGRSGYSLILIDSLSHAWDGEDGALDQVSRAKDRGNTFTAWKDVTPAHNKMIQAILRSPCHIIATMRSKTEYVLELNEKGKQVPRKVGMAPIQRAGMEYEFDLYFSMDDDHVMHVSKSRCPDLDRAVLVKPSANTFEPFARWLEDGADVPEGYYAPSTADFDLLEKQRVDAIKAKPISAMEKNQQIAAVKAEIKALRDVGPASVVANAETVATAEPEPDPSLAVEKPKTARVVKSVDVASDDEGDGMTQDLNKPVTPALRSEILAQVATLEKNGHATIIDLVKSMLSRNGMEKLTDMSIREGEKLLVALKSKDFDQFLVNVYFDANAGA